MKKILEKILGGIAAAIIKKYKPVIIGITGSAGKTSTKQAVFAALSGSYDVRATPKNYNNELGLPLTIIGGKAAGKNFFAWLAIILHGWSYLIFNRRFPKMLVLEMGADKPGDLAKLVAIAPPRLSIITSIGEAHMEFFGSIGAIAEEKETLVKVLPPDGYALLSADDPRVFSMRSVTKAKVVTYGFSETADMRASGIEYIHAPLSTAVLGLRLAVPGPSGLITVDLPGVVGRGHALAALAGLAAAKILGVPLAIAAEGLRDYAPPPGRMRLIPGIKGTVIIDDTYNASPGAMREALEVLKNFSIPDKARRIALLGDMRELGAFTERAHREVGEYVAHNGIDLFVAVGEAMFEALSAAKRNGMSEDRTIHMVNAVAAAHFLEERLHAGDVILIKGSQNTIRLERAVKALMLEPERSEELLCRQGKEWEA
jgi:UDP-N-acetylmuramoyl-tripeptide--D-alanyl-D-alanine ligase